MTNSSDRRPFSMPYVATTTLGGLSGTAMIARAPWPSPVSKYFVLRKLVAASPVVVSGNTINVWDQDLSNTTPVSRGSGAAPLMTIPIVGVTTSGAQTPGMTVLDIDACPQQYFQAGFTLAPNTNGGCSGITIYAEFDVV